MTLLRVFKTLFKKIFAPGWYLFFLSGVWIGLTVFSALGLIFFIYNASNTGDWSDFYIYLNMMNFIVGYVASAVSLRSCRNFIERSKSE